MEKCDFCKVELTKENKDRHESCKECIRRMRQLDFENFSFQIVGDKIRLTHTDADDREESVMLDRDKLLDELKWTSS